MVSITLTSASNGVIKRVVDDNYNGAGEKFAVTKVYTIENGAVDAGIMTLHLINDLVDDLGVDTGAPQHEHTLNVGLEWGENYVPKIKEVNARIASLREQLALLRGLKDQLKE